MPRGHNSAVLELSHTKNRWEHLHFMSMSTKFHCNSKITVEALCFRNKPLLLVPLISSYLNCFYFKTNEIQIITTHRGSILLLISMHFCGLTVGGNSSTQTEPACLTWIEQGLHCWVSIALTTKPARQLLNKNSDGQECLTVL